MKKKASLLISGITTVAMLAVAVGSFAAWDTLKDEGNTLSVTTSTPTTLKAESVDAVSKLKLIPKDKDATEVTVKEGASDLVNVGTLKVTLTAEDMTKVEVVPTIKVGNKNLSDADNPYNVIIKTQGSTPTEVTNKLTGLDTSATETTYDVFIEFKEDAATIDGSKYTASTTPTISIDLTASAVTV